MFILLSDSHKKLYICSEPKSMLILFKNIYVTHSKMPGRKYIKLVTKAVLTAFAPFSAVGKHTLSAVTPMHASLKSLHYIKSHNKNHRAYEANGVRVHTPKLYHSHIKNKGGNLITTVIW